MDRELLRRIDRKAVAALPLWLMMILGDRSTAHATVAVCDQDGNCMQHAAPPPDFGVDPQHPNRAGGAAWPMFSLWDQEPYRNSDMGPLGVVLSTGEFQITVTDMEIPGRGFPFLLTRTYRSRRDGERSLLGYNWQ